MAFASAPVAGKSSLTSRSSWPTHAARPLLTRAPRHLRQRPSVCFYRRHGLLVRSGRNPSASHTPMRMPTDRDGGDDGDDVDDVDDGSNGTQPSAVNLLASAFLVGVAVGGAVTYFKVTIDLVHDVLWGDVLAGHLFPLLGTGVLVAVPLFGGLLVAAIAATANTPAATGLAALTAEIAAAQPPKSATLALRKVTAAIATLASGLSLGPEQICVEIGAFVARWVGFFSMGGPQRTGPAGKQQALLLLAAGVAAGVSAGFNAPIAGTVFAFEVFVAATPIAASTAYAPASSAAIMVAAAVSALVARAGLGDAPVFSHLALYELKEPIFELPLYLALGAIAGLASAAFTCMLRESKKLFASDQLSFLVDRSLAPVAAALICGTVALWRPETLFFGYDMLNAILANSEVSITVLLSLIVLKPLMTSLCLGAGLVGGTLAPSLFFGACVGSAFRTAVFEAASFVIGPDAAGNLIAQSPAYAMVGMAACLAGCFRAPLTATILLFELTRDYRIVVPLAAASGVSAWVVDYIKNQNAAAESSYGQNTAIDQTKKVLAPERRQRNDPSDLELVDRIDAAGNNQFGDLSVEDVMLSEPGLIPLSSSLEQAVSACITMNQATIIVLNSAGFYYGTLSASTLASAIGGGSGSNSNKPTTIRSLVDRNSPSVSEGTPLSKVDRLVDLTPSLGLVPVLQSDSKKVVGAVDVSTPFSARATLERLRRSSALLSSM